MEAGELRHRITVQKKVVTRDTYGAETITWTTHCKAYAAILPLVGREFLEARQTQAEMITKMRIRYQAGIEPEMRVLWGSRTYDIQSVIHVEERQREIVLMCMEQL
jgi:SPP1 family predicted phage head-tail adaptor